MKEYSLKYHDFHFRSLKDISFITYSEGLNRLDLIVCGVHLTYDLAWQDMYTVHQLINDWSRVVKEGP